MNLFDYIHSQNLSLNRNDIILPFINTSDVPVYVTEINRNLILTCGVNFFFFNYQLLHSYIEEIPYRWSDYWRFIINKGNHRLFTFCY